MQDLSQILPVGSVVSLKHCEHRVMIDGILQLVEDGEKRQTFDYIGVPYPEGALNEELKVFFQHEDIERLFFRGYNDAERQEFLHQLQKEPLLEEVIAQEGVKE